MASLIPSPSELAEDLKVWIQERGLWWATSVTAHAVVLLSLALLVVAVPQKEGSAPAFVAPVDTEVQEVIEPFEIGHTPLDPTELNNETLTLEAPSVSEQINGSPDEEFTEAGGGMASTATTNLAGQGIDVKGLGPGPSIRGLGGAGGSGTGKNAGSGGAGSGFGGRGSGVRKAMLGTGGTKQSERAVAGALNWLARHQNPDGSWSLENYSRMCKSGDPSCSGSKASVNSDAGATAMALLPFLAAGQTPKKGEYKANIYKGLYWLATHQKNDGDLSAGSGQIMYTHGLATITMCEAYGMTGDRNWGAVAQQAINFIERSQNTTTGGWRYKPGDPGDTSVVGWQVMGLKSGLMAGLKVSSPVLEGAHKFLKSCAKGKGGTYSYEPNGAATPAMSAVGLLCVQYLGTQRNDPGMQEGMAYLMSQMPDMNARNCYYWYYATQVMHNLPGYEWDTWNRKMRRILIESQVKDIKQCANGSWDPDKATKDAWGEHGGRIMITSLCCLTLEVYYRYLPLYKLDGKGKGPGDKPAAAEKEKPAADKK